MDILLSQHQNKTHVYAMVGQFIELNIPAHPKTGQVWNWTAGFDLLDMVGTPLAYKHGAVVQVMQKWRFRVKKAGNGILRISEARPGDAYASLAAFEVRLTASPDPKLSVPPYRK